MHELLRNDPRVRLHNPVEQTNGGHGIDAQSSKDSKAFTSRLLRRSRPLRTAAVTSYEVAKDVVIDSVTLTVARIRPRKMNQLFCSGRL